MKGIIFIHPITGKIRKYDRTGIYKGLPQSGVKTYDSGVSDQESPHHTGIENFTMEKDGDHVTLSFLMVTNLGDTKMKATLFEEMTYEKIMSDMMADMPDGISTERGSLLFNACAKQAARLEEAYLVLNGIEKNMFVRIRQI